MEKRKKGLCWSRPPMSNLVRLREEAKEGEEVGGRTSPLGIR